MIVLSLGIVGGVVDKDIRSGHLYMAIEYGLGVVEDFGTSGRVQVMLDILVVCTCRWIG
jgi:hypothetical protein